MVLGSDSSLWRDILSPTSNLFAGILRVFDDFSYLSYAAISAAYAKFVASYSLSTRDSTIHSL
jgi:hypothetical protein